MYRKSELAVLRRVSVTIFVILGVICFMSACDKDNPVSPVYEIQRLKVVAEKLVCLGRENTRLEIRWGFEIEVDDTDADPIRTVYLSSGEAGGFDEGDQIHLNDWASFGVLKVDGARFRLKLDMTEIDHIIDPDNPDEAMNATSNWISYPFVNQSGNTMCQAGTQKVKVYWRIELD